jgi:hypothetical protein
VLFGEDGARVTKDHVPENLNIMRKTALSLLWAAPLPRNPIIWMSGSKRRFAADLDPMYIFTVLFGK